MAKLFIPIIIQQLHILQLQLRLQTIKIRVAATRDFLRKIEILLLGVL